MSDPNHDDERIDATPMLYMPSDLLRGLFADVTPGSAQAASIARLLHTMAAFLTGERRPEGGTESDPRLMELTPEQASKRAVELMELAETLDGIGGAPRGAAR